MLDLNKRETFYYITSKVKKPEQRFLPRVSFNFRQQNINYKYLVAGTFLVHKYMKKTVSIFDINIKMSNMVHWTSKKLTIPKNAGPSIYVGLFEL